MFNKLQIACPTCGSRLAKVSVGDTTHHGNAHRTVYIDSYKVQGTTKLALVKSEGRYLMRCTKAKCAWNCSIKSVSLQQAAVQACREDLEVLVMIPEDVRALVKAYPDEPQPVSREVGAAKFLARLNSGKRSQSESRRSKHISRETPETFQAQLQEAILSQWQDLHG